MERRFARLLLRPHDRIVPHEFSRLRSPVETFRVLAILIDQASSVRVAMAGDAVVLRKPSDCFAFFRPHYSRRWSSSNCTVFGKQHHESTKHYLVHEGRIGPIETAFVRKHDHVWRILDSKRFSTRIEFINELERKKLEG